MRIINQADMKAVDVASFGSPIMPGNILFTDKRELRTYVLDITKRILGDARAKLPLHIRFLISEDRLNAVVEWAFQRVWPYHGDVPV